MSRPLEAAIVFGLALNFAGIGASQTSFSWEKYRGQQINLLISNHPWTDAISKRFETFTVLTGIRIKSDIYQEAQMRQRLTILLQGRSPDVDVFMSLKSREGLLYYRAGWYTTLDSFVSSESHSELRLDDFSPALIRGETFEGKLVGLPINIEGPVLYYRKDIFARCKIALPQTLDELVEALSSLKRCVPDLVPITTRGLASAIPYTFSNVLRNFGGSYLDLRGRSNLCSAEGVRAIEYYARLLKDFGPPGFENNTFYQNTELFGTGRAVISYESSNELSRVLTFPGRANDTGILVLPRGPGDDRPTVIGWGISISAYSRNPGAAWYFLQWATSPRVQLQLALEGIAPPRSSIWRDTRFNAWINAAPVRQEWAKALQYMSTRGTSEVGPPIVRQPEAREIIGQAVLQVALGRASAQVAACEADRQIDRLIAASP